MIIIVILLLAAIASIGVWQYQVSHTAALAYRVQIEQIHAANRLDLAPWVTLGILIIAAAVVLAFYFRRPVPVVNDNRTVYLMLPDGQSKRQMYKQLGTYNALPLAQPVKVLESRKR